MRPVLTSDSFSGKAPPAGKEFRDGVLGQALNDVYKDIDDGFIAAEVRISSLETYSPVILTKTHADHATETVTITAPFDLTVLDVYVVKTTDVGADNGANTVQVKNHAATAITDAMSIRNKAVGDVVRMASYTASAANVDSGDTIKITFTRADAGDDNAAVVYVTCIRR